MVLALRVAIHTKKRQVQIISHLFWCIMVHLISKDSSSVGAYTD